MRSRLLLACVGALMFSVCPACADTLDAAEQFDFADGLYTRGLYEMAAGEYAKYIQDFSEGGNIELAHYRAGECWYALGDYEKATSFYQEQIKRFPAGAKADEARFRLAEIPYRKKEYDKAVERFGALVESSARPEIKATSMYYLGKAHYEKQDYAKSTANFMRLVEEFPKSELICYARFHAARSYAAQDMPEKAAEQFMAVATDSSDTTLRAESLFRAAETYDSMGWYKQAAETYRSLAAGFSSNPLAREAAYAEAWALYNDKQYDEAMAQAETVLEKFPRSRWTAGTLYLKGNCLQAKGSYDDAIKTYNQIIAVESTGEFADKARYKVCWAQYFKGDKKSALDSAKKLLADRGEEPIAGDALFLIGLVHLDEHRYTDASAAFEKVERAYSGSEFAADALYNLGRAYEEANAHTAAADALKRFAEKHPDDKRATEAMFRSGRAALQGEKLEKAIATYEQIASSTRTAKVREEALYCLALAYLEAERTEEAIETFSGVLKDFPDTDRADEIYYTLGRTCLLRGDYGQAVANLENVGKKDAASSYRGSALADLGYAYLQLERHDDAVRTLVEVVRSHPEIALTGQTYLWLGERLFRTGEFDAAAQVLESFLANGKPTTQQAELAGLRLAQCYLNAGRIDAAKKGFGALLKDFPDGYYTADAEYGVGLCLSREKEYDEALSHLSRVLELDEGRTAAKAHIEIGDIYWAKNDFEAASKAYLRVALLYHDLELTPLSLFKAARCFEKMNRPSEATKFYNELIEKYPDSSHAAEARKKIEGD